MVVLAVPFLVTIPTIAAGTDTDDTKIADTDETGDETSEGDFETADIAVVVVIIILFIPELVGCTR